MGNEVFWTVTADNISSMILMDIDGDGQNEVGINRSNLCGVMVLTYGHDPNKVREFKSKV